MCFCLSLLVILVMTVGTAQSATAAPFARGPSVARRPTVMPGPRGAVLTMPSGATAVLGPGRPILRSPDDVSFASLVLYGDLRVAGRWFGLSVQVFVDRPGTPSSDTEFFLSLGTARGIQHFERSFAFEDHAYSRSLRDSSFRFRSNLTRARLETAGQLGRWGSIDMRFRSNSAVQTSCGGRTRLRTGEAHGQLVFTPRHDNGVFGTIARARFTSAELWVSRCHQSFSGEGTPRCPNPSVMAWADRFDGVRYQSFFASTDGSTEETGFESAIEQEFWPRMSVIHEIFAGVPDSRIDAQPDAVHIRGTSSSFLPGAATVTAEMDPYVDGPFPCRGGDVSFEFVESSFIGGPGRPLTADFTTGAMSAPTGPSDWTGAFVTTIVMPAP